MKKLLILCALLGFACTNIDSTSQPGISTSPRPDTRPDATVKVDAALTCDLRDEVILNIEDICETMWNDATLDDPPPYGLDEWIDDYCFKTIDNRVGEAYEAFRCGECD